MVYWKITQNILLLLNYLISCWRFSNMVKLAITIIVTINTKILLLSSLYIYIYILLNII